MGEAAGQVKVSTVGGMVTGLRGARAVADAVLNGGHSTRVANSLKRELDLHLLVRKAMHPFTTRDYMRLFDLLNRGVTRSLGVFDRDEIGRLLRSLLLRQPRLALLGLRGMLSRTRFV